MLKKNLMNIGDLDRCILSQTWAYIKLWGQTIDINTLFIQYELAYAHNIYTLTEVIQV